MKTLISLTLLFVAFASVASANTLERHLTHSCSDPMVKSQKNAFHRLSPKEKSLVMRTHLGELTAELSLTQQQREYLQQAFELATPDAYAGKDSGDIEALARQEQMVFRDLPLWSKLSPGANALLYSFDKKRSEYQPISMMDGQLCTCANDNSGDCVACSDGSKRPCGQTAGTTCIPTDDGCGFLWMQRCFGYCMTCFVTINPHEA